jgi:hypothetical protein
MIFAVARNAARQSGRAAFVRSTVYRPFAIRGLASASAGWLDVTKEIKIDHNNVRDLFSRCACVVASGTAFAYEKRRYKAASELNEKKLIANTLIREMSIHGDAEYDYMFLHYEI